MDGLISSHRVMVFSKTTCGFCSRVKAFFAEKGVQAEILELDQIADGGDIQAYLKEKTGLATVPNVFINGKHLGKTPC